MLEPEISRRKLLRFALGALGGVGAAAGLAALAIRGGSSLSSFSMPRSGLSAEPADTSWNPMMNESKAFIAAPLGTSLSAEEKSFFGGERPWGYILFARNIESENQLRDLVAGLKELGGRDSTPIFIDQEGGRITRLKPPMAPAYPAPDRIGQLYASDPEAGERAAWLQGRLLAADIMRYGINADCIPCLDVPVAGANSVIGDRAYGTNPETVATLGRAIADGAIAGGVMPVGKHIPGHGRGNADSHHALPTVETGRDELACTDFAPFKALSQLPAAMTAHILYSAIDPTSPATLSPTIIGSVIRREIGFDGLLMSDDISMKALDGDLYDLSVSALAAGCDVVLHCNGDLGEMLKVARAAQPLSGDAARRAAAAEAVISAPAHFDDVDSLREEFASLMGALA